MATAGGDIDTNEDDADPDTEFQVAVEARMVTPTSQVIASIVEGARDTDRGRQCRSTP